MPLESAPEPRKGGHQSKPPPDHPDSGVGLIRYLTLNKGTRVPTAPTPFQHRSRDLTSVRKTLTQEGSYD